MNKYLILFLVYLVHLSLLVTNANSQWIRTTIPENASINSLAVIDSSIFASTYDSVFYSGDNGATWIARNSGLPIVFILTLVANESTLFIGTYGNDVFRSTNKGLTWTAADSGFLKIGDYSDCVFSFAANGTSLFAGTGFGVFQTTNNGVSWVSSRLGLPAGSIQSLATNDSYLFAGVHSSGLFRSSDNGVTWAASDSGFGLDFSYYPILSVASKDSHVLAGTASGTFLSSNNGTSWAPLYFWPIHSCLFIGSNILATTSGGGVFLSSDNGEHWNETNSGLTRDPYYDEYLYSAITTANSYFFVGSQSPTKSWLGEVWRRPTSEIVITTQGISPRVPSEFLLEQNYPNPFNSSTTIRFTLPSQSYCTLAIYDMLGREVLTLVSEVLPHGSYSQSWTPQGTPSGVYFLRLSAGSFTQTKKLVILR
jgi:hypothetical protein